MATFPLDQQYNRRVNDVMTNMARFIPVVMVLYGLAVQLNLTDGSSLYSWQAFVAIVAALIVTGVTQPSGFGQSPLRQFIYYVLFLSFAVFVSGVESVLLFWTPLSITTILNFNKNSFWWTTLLLYAFVSLDSLIRWPVSGVGLLFNNLILATLTTISAGLVILIVLALMKDHRSLITVRRRESLQFSRMQALVNSIDQAILSVDTHGFIRLYNSAALSLLDTNRSPSGHKLDTVLNIHGPGGKKLNLFDQVLKSNRTLYQENYRHYFDDGEKIRLAITATAIHTSFSHQKESTQGYIFIIRDITKIKSMEEERDEFISVISHELRTPITIAEASISNMQFFAQKQKLSHDVVKGLGDAHDQIVFLAKMINDLSALARAERPDEVSKEEIDADLTLENIYKEYASQARDKQLLLNLDVAGPLGTLTTNKLYFEEMMQNFITNALKYTAEGSITIHGKKVDGGLRFCVSDTGIGISKSDRLKVFDKFYRSEDYRTRETGGTGLGLYVARKLADKLGTTIHLESRLHHGSTFWFDLLT